MQLCDTVLMFTSLFWDFVNKPKTVERIKDLSRQGGHNGVKSNKKVASLAETLILVKSLRPC